MNAPIDLVLPWVDDRDEAWQREFRESLKKYPREEGAESHIHFENWDNLYLWFRAVEKFMPWIHRVVLITWGHVPEFLDLSHKKLLVVRHRDYLPAEYLPTYNSNVIELNVHRIQDLAENFILFNDDTFPLAPVEESYYFQKDLPCDEAVEGIIVPKEEGAVAHMARYTQVNNLMVINRHFEKRKMQEEHREKWFSPAYGSLLERTESLSYWNILGGIHDPHMANALKKSTLAKLWELEPEVLDRCSRNHFRAHTDVTQYLIRYWQICTGEFVPRRTMGKMCLIDMSNYLEYAESISRGAYPMVSINESCTPEEFRVIKKAINEALEELLPEKSSFERQSCSSQERQ